MINDLTLIMVRVGAFTHMVVPMFAFATSLIFNPLRKGAEGKWT